LSFNKRCYEEAAQATCALCGAGIGVYLYKQIEAATNKLKGRAYAS